MALWNTAVIERVRRRDTGEEQADALFLGKRFYIFPLREGENMRAIDDEGQNLLTSRIECLRVNLTHTEVTTMNSIYVLRWVE